MRVFGVLALFGFGVQAILGLLTLSIAPSMVSARIHQGPLFVAITLLTGGLIFVSLNVLPAIACWTLYKRQSAVGNWVIAASLVNIAWSPLVASCTTAGAVAIALIGVCGLAAFWTRPMVRA